MYPANNYDSQTDYVLNGAFTFGDLSPIAYCYAMHVPHTRHAISIPDMLIQARGGSLDALDSSICHAVNNCNQRMRSYLAMLCKQNLLGWIFNQAEHISHNATDKFLVDSSLLKQFVTEPKKEPALSAPTVGDDARYHLMVDCMSSHADTLTVAISNEHAKELANMGVGSFNTLYDLFIPANIAHVVTSKLSRQKQQAITDANKFIVENYSTSEHKVYAQSMLDLLKTNFPTEEVPFVEQVEDLEPILPPKKLRKSTRKAILRAMNLFSMLGAQSHVKAFIGGGAIDVEGAVFNYKLTKDRPLESVNLGSAHIPYSLEIVDKDTGLVLCKACVVFKGQPQLDQVFSLLMVIRAGKESEEELLHKANFYSFQIDSPKSHEVLSRYFTNTLSDVYSIDRARDTRTNKDVNREAYDTFTRGIKKIAHQSYYRMMIEGLSDSIYSKSGLLQESFNHLNLTSARESLLSSNLIMTHLGIMNINQLKGQLHNGI
ncbi:hypothetical protein VCHA53O466_50505 [Vibrio chagasii]|nr:hypothetical protein VCHA53O466_50505 [Vibrio chagasii]